MTTYTANDLYDMFANQADPDAIAATSTAALAADLEELDTEAGIENYIEAAEQIKAIARSLHRGPGRPKLDAGGPIDRITVTLPASLVEQARRMGDGNVSAGIRKALNVNQFYGCCANCNRAPSACGPIDADGYCQACQWAK